MSILSLLLGLLLPSLLGGKHGNAAHVVTTMDVAQPIVDTLYKCCHQLSMYQTSRVNTLYTVV